MAGRAGVDAPLFPVLSLGAITRGEEAVLALGDSLSAVAKAYGLTAEQLTVQLRSDASLAVDPEGRLLFLDILVPTQDTPLSPHIPSPPVRGRVSLGTDIPSPPVRGGVNPGTDIPSPPVRGGTGTGTDIPSPPVRRVTDGEAGLPGTDIPSPPVRGGVSPGTDIPSPPVRGGTGTGTDIPSPPVRRVIDGEAGLPGTDIPSPPIRGGVNPGTDIPSPPVRGGTGTGTDIPSPPVRRVTDGTAEVPNTDIPSPPVRGGSNPGADIPSPPVRRVTDGAGENLNTDIPSPPIRGGVVNPGTDIPSPPIRPVADGAARTFNTDIPSPPVRAGVSPMVDIPSPPIRGLKGSVGVLTLGGETGPSTADPSIDGESVELHSSPGSARVIELDFNGATVSGTVWNESWFQGQRFTAPAFDRDGQPQGLNAVERAQIVEIWKRVSEDFAPFDVDVTTAAAAGEAVLAGRGVRVLITPMGQSFPGYSGVSYLGSFGSTGPRWNTALVFADVLGLDQTKAIAEAISHQVGHSLGLLHHALVGESTPFAGIGSGDTGWAPIMGDASVRSLSHWSRGEYPGASSAQDDIARIQAAGLTLRDDDHGDSVDAASHLPLGTRWTAGGLVGEADDRDVFAFESGQGAVGIQVSPEEVGANLDVEARLLDSTGALVAESAPVDVLGASFDLVLPAGRYFLVVSGNGYGSLGRYTVSGRVPEPVRQVPPVSVIGPTPSVAEAFVPIVFDGSLSFDQDDTLATYVWDFGDGTRTEGVTVTHAFQIPGSYGVTLTVTDEAGLSHSSAVGLRITPPNLAPQAVISTDVTSGYAPLAVVFDGSRSVDPDGAVIAHRWDFGDGRVVTGPMVRREFSRPGVHRVTLTVVDNQGAESSVTTSITVAQREICIGSITVRTAASGLSRVAYATVRITHPDGSPVAGAAVTGSWLGSLTQSRGIKTDANGVVEIASPRVTRSTKLTFTVTGVSLENARYTPALNRATSLTVVVGP